MVTYVVILRAIATIIITNSHYTNVYPVQIIASGGLIGDILFFSLSGFFLGNIKESFLEWYKKRFSRIFPSVWLITGIYIFLGFYSLSEKGLFYDFIYPTRFHFIASIVILYIPYFIIAKKEKYKFKVPLVISITFLIQLLYYAFLYDKSFYHIENVKEPMIRFLFFQSMLIGLYFRVNNERLTKKNFKMNWLMMIVSLFSYTIVRVLFIQNRINLKFQILTNILLLISLFYILKSFSGIESKLIKLPKIILRPIKFLSQMTLQIYLVQYVIISKFEKYTFPLNWLLITAVICLSAFILMKFDKLSRNISVKKPA